MKPKTTGAVLLELKARAGDPSLDTIRKAAGYSQKSSVQAFFNVNYQKQLDTEVAAKLCAALVGKGEPPITREEIFRLTGAPVPAVMEETEYEPRNDDVSVKEWDFAYGMGGGTSFDLPVKSTLHTFSRSWLRKYTHAPAVRIFLAMGTGDSMMPTILDADTVLIDTAEKEVRTGDKIWAIVYGNSGYIKRLRPMPDGSVKILSDNPNVPPETAYDGELSVVGRVVAVIRKT